MAETGTNPDGSKRTRLDQLPRQVNLAAWHTPTANPATYTGGNAPGFLNLPGEVKLAAWPTPMAGSPATENYNEAGNNDSSRKTVQLAAWPSPCTPNGGRSMLTEVMDATGKTLDGKKHTASLEHAVKFAGWPTPDAQKTTSAKGTEDRPSRAATGRTTGYLAEAAVSYAVPGPVRLTAGGQMLTGSDAGMASSGQLNPEHSLWLQGIPVAWVSYASRATPSVSRQRKRSSKAISKQGLKAMGKETSRA